MKNLVFFVSFFSLNGYYAGLAFIFYFNITALSRYYSVPIRVLIAIIMLIIVLRNRKLLMNNKNSKYLTLFILFWVFYFLKVLYSESINLNDELTRVWYEYLLFALLYVIIPFLGFCAIDLDKYKNNILDGFISSGFVLGVISLFLYGKYLVQGIGRLSFAKYQTGEETLNPLALSYAGALTIVLCVHRLLILKEKNKLQVLYLFLTIILSFIMFLLGSSRGSVIAIMLCIPVFISYSAFKQKIKFITLSILSIPIFIWAIEASGSNILKRIGNTAEDGGGGRDSLWSKAFYHFLDNPVIGGKIEIGGIYPHNFLIEILMATGLIGFLIILPVLIKGFTLGRKQAKINSSYLFPLLVFIVGIIQHSFSGGLYTSVGIFVPLALLYSSARI